MHIMAGLKRQAILNILFQQHNARDLTKDSLYKWLEQGGDWRKAHKLCFRIGIAYRIVLLLCFGWVVALAEFTAALIVQHIPLLLNVVCHMPKLGYKNYFTPDGSVNVWWVADANGWRRLAQ